MNESLLLSYLPTPLAFHKSLNAIKELKEAPSASHIARTLCESGELEPKLVWSAVNTALKKAENFGNERSLQKIRAIDFWASHFPHSLRLIKKAPWNLFYMGELPCSPSSIAIVGSRHPNDYGVKVLTQILPQVQTRPLEIISGLALGIDAIAHDLACSLSIVNFAVLGCGLDYVYPEQNTMLAKKILNMGGGILSEFPPGTAPLSHHFPRRNRIISGLAEIVWIVQGTIKSGSVHTVRHALQQDKTVAATPGDIFTELSSLPNRLVYDGAQLILRAEDIDLLFRNTQARFTH